VPRYKLARPNYILRRRGEIWVVSWTDPETGRTRSISTGARDETGAGIWRDQWLAGLDQPLPPSEPRIADVLDHYLAERKVRVAAYDTLEWACQGLRRHLGNLEPRMLSRRMYIDKRASENVSDGTIGREISTLRAALALAERDGWIPKAPYVEMPPRPPARDRWLTREELDRLVLAAGAPHIKLFVILAYHTAARAGAILDLTWDRVDFARRLITYDRPGRRRSNKRRATVPANVVALAELQAAREVATTDHVIEFRGRPIDSIKHAFARACERAGIEDCSPHVLRHSSITQMVLDGIPVGQIARFAGDTETMIERVYGHHHPDYLRAAADALAGRKGPRSISVISPSPASDTRESVDSNGQKRRNKRAENGRK
jgi:integrase